jgi:predicted CopG family antitoxin
MAVKTITIDLEAYRLLKAHKRGNESFSKAIKRHFVPSRTARALLANLERVALAEETLDRIEELVRARSDDLASSPDFDPEK